MRLFPKEIVNALEEQGQIHMDAQRLDEDKYPLGLPPVVKLFGGAYTYLISESTPGNPDLLFGLCDIGMGFPELGYVSRRELEHMQVPILRGLLGWLERDLYTELPHPVGVYARAARRANGVTGITPTNLAIALREIAEGGMPENRVQVTGYWNHGLCPRGKRHGTLKQARDCRDERGGSSEVEIRFVHDRWQAKDQLAVSS